MLPSHRDWDVTGEGSQHGAILGSVMILGLIIAQVAWSFGVALLFQLGEFVGVLGAGSVQEPQVLSSDRRLGKPDKGHHWKCGSHLGFML